jgi:hypothetical protein
MFWLRAAPCGAFTLLRDMSLHRNIRDHKASESAQMLSAQLSA